MTILSRKLKIGIIAGEPSGDLLGAGLITSLKRLHPDIEVCGIGGPAMIAAGCTSLFAMEKLSVMGLFEILSRLPELLKIRRKCIHFLKEFNPDIFIGIDAPDFNLKIEEQLKKAGILTVHYTSPTVWAWRASRLKKIKRATDLMLTLFPFELSYYREKGIAAKFVGHPLADQISLEPDMLAAREKLNLDQRKKIVALLPGSRSGEIARLGPIFLDTVQWCLERRPELHFIAPMINQSRFAQFDKLIKKTAPHLPITLLNGQSHLAMEASDAVLLSSGTATLEAALLKKPMTVAYRCSAATYQIAKLMVHVNSIVLPNLLAGFNFIPEFIQHEVTCANLGSSVLKNLDDENRNYIIDVCSDIHTRLRQNANEKAARAVMELMTDRK